MPLLRLQTLPLRLLTLPLRLLTLPLRLLMPLLRPSLRRTDPIGSGMKAHAGRNPVCVGFCVFAA